MATDPGGPKGDMPRPQSYFFHFHAVFSAKILPIGFHSKLRGWRLPDWEILDLPLT